MFTILSDIILNLNTRRLTDGKLLCTRRKILLNYLRRECCFDIILLANIVFTIFSSSEDLRLVFHITSLIAAVFKLRHKGELLHTYFSFKQFVALLDSVLLLLTVSHLNVTIIILRHYCSICRPDSYLKDAGCSTLVLKIKDGSPSISTLSTGQSQPS